VINRHPESGSAGDQRSGTLCSVVLCTLGRSATLRRAVTSVLAQRDVELELILVDNEPATGRTLAAIVGLSDDRLRYIVQPRRGLSAARNAGVAAATGSVIVFTDDDCTVDPGWLQAIVTLFDQHPDVDAVTGRTLAEGPTTPYQELFEEFGSFNRGEERTVWQYRPKPAMSAPNRLADLGTLGAAAPIFPYSAVYGSGNNMAFRSATLQQVGPFDESLGAGSPSAGGEDLDMFIRVMLAGLVIVYEPAALVWHSHRSDAGALSEQVRNYGSGLSAMITKHLLLDTPSRIRILRRVLPGLRHLFSADSAKNVRKSPGFPSALTRLELIGLIRGPWLYLRGRATLRRSPDLALPWVEPTVARGDDRRVA
jgi:glycosyltransferase involved in cell wall biosynthesis